MLMYWLKPLRAYLSPHLVAVGVAVNGTVVFPKGLIKVHENTGTLHTHDKVCVLSDSTATHLAGIGLASWTWLVWCQSTQQDGDVGMGSVSPFPQLGEAPRT